MIESRNLVSSHMCSLPRDMTCSVWDTQGHQAVSGHTRRVSATAVCQRQRRGSSGRWIGGCRWHARRAHGGRAGGDPRRLTEWHGVWRRTISLSRSVCHSFPLARASVEILTLSCLGHLKAEYDISRLIHCCRPGFCRGGGGSLRNACAAAIRLDVAAAAATKATGLLAPGAVPFRSAAGAIFVWLIAIRLCWIASNRACPELPSPLCS